MIHQLTALILSCLMLVVSATSQVGLHFCQCEKTVFMGDCPCDEIPEKEVASACSCCESDDVTEREIPNPCDDCDLIIELELDDCVTQWGSDYKVSSEHSLIPVQAFIAQGGIGLQSGEVNLLEIRGGPPPSLLSCSSPLYLRYSVFLI